MTNERQVTSDDDINAALQELAERSPEWGFGKYFQLIRLPGYGWMLAPTEYPPFCYVEIIFTTTRSRDVASKQFLAGERTRL
jgi:hypothetical protein